MYKETEELKTMQPFFYMNSTTYQQEWYLQQGISHFYNFSTGTSSVICAVPDGCIDMVFVYTEDGMEAYVHGTVLDYQETELAPYADVFCVRFNAGEMPAILEGMPEKYLNRFVPMESVVKSDTLISAMSSASDFFSRMNTFLREYDVYYNRKPTSIGKERLVEVCRDLMIETDGKVKIFELAEKTGYSTRYINKVFFDTMGFSPKVFCKIIQFQRSLEFLNFGTHDKMTDAAVQLGYYDQPQFIRDFKTHCGMTPKKYTMLVKKQNYLGRMREFYRTDRFAYPLPIAN